jgi:hypothetical protein
MGREIDVAVYPCDDHAGWDRAQEIPDERGDQGLLEDDR